MSRESKTAVVRAVYERWAHGDLSASVPLLAPHVALVIDAGIPEGGTYAGPAGVRQYMSRFLDSWDSLTIRAESFEEGANAVLVTARQQGVGRSSGALVDQRYFQVWTFEEGLVIRLETILAEPDARAAAGLEG